MRLPYDLDLGPVFAYVYSLTRRRPSYGRQGCCNNLDTFMRSMSTAPGADIDARTGKGREEKKKKKAGGQW